MRNARGGPSLAGSRKAGWGITMGKRRRRGRDRADGLRTPCFASHLPPENPRPAPRGVHRAAVGRSSGSGRGAWRSTSRPSLPGRGPSAMTTFGSTTAAGQCRSGPEGRTGFPFHPEASHPRNRRPQDRGGAWRRQHQMLCGTAEIDAMRVSRVESFSPLVPPAKSCQLKPRRCQDLLDRVSKRFYWSQKLSSRRSRRRKGSEGTARHCQLARQSWLPRSFALQEP